MTYEFLQQYWWFLISLLGALLVFLMFVQGANSMIFALGKNEAERRLVVNSTGRKWEFTFTTLVTFGGAYFASFPLFYSTSFGGAYWLWMAILLSFVLQAVSYEFQNKIGNVLGAKTFQAFLVFNGIVGPLLLGGAVATFFEGSNFVVEKNNLITEGLTPVISHWANGSAGLDALLNPWVLVLGIAVVFLTQTLGLLYIINNVDDETITVRARKTAMGCVAGFLVFFLAYLAHLLVKDGFAADANGTIVMEPYKYFNNLIALWPVAVILLVGVVLYLLGMGKTLFSKTFCKGIWPAGIGVVLVVMSLLMLAGYNDTAYYPSTADLQSSLTLANSCSSETTLTAMFYVSLLIPFVLAYIAYAWYAIDKKKLTADDIKNDHAY
ncbi:MAG: cytochrome d ubiquinol oxidase subunit II [Muribaculaceae bacterium]|nr:cytochrome d ubiquinol oxidase subunit II [Muribaculaceae bacterium]